MAQCAVWEVRWSKANRDERTLRSGLATLAKKWVFQEEVGDGGYEHFQGRVSLFKKRRKGELMELMRKSDFPIPEYLEPTVSAEHKKAAFYAMKEDTRVDGPWTNKDEIIWIAPEWEAPNEWYPWQRTVLESREIRNQRTINLVVDSEGNNGKTHLAMYMECKGLATVVPNMTDAKEICECVCDELMLKEERDPRVVIMDLPRAMSKKTLAGVFSAIENIKNGKVIDRRYSLKKWMFRPPQVWIFTNRIPNMAYMSRDRWRVWSIKNKILQWEDIRDRGHDHEIDQEYRGGYGV